MALHHFSVSMSGPYERESRSLSLSFETFSSLVSSYREHVFARAFPEENHQIPSNTELKALSGDHATSPHPLWVIDPLGQVILLARHLTHNTTHSLISSYLSPGMQPLILRNTLSFNTLGKPGSTLQDIGVLPHNLLTCVLKQGKNDKDLTYWRDSNKCVLCGCDCQCFFQKKRQSCARFAHCVVFSAGSLGVGALHYAF